MKKLIFIFCSLFFSISSASVLDILNNKGTSFTLEKKLQKDIGSVFPFSKKPQDFIKAFENKDFEKALDIWLKSIKNTSFAKSSTGSALYSYLLFKNGFEVLSLKNLLEKSQPNEINPIVSNLWKTSIDEKHSLWNNYFFPIGKEWQGFFPTKIVFNLGAKSPLQLQRDQEYIKFLLSLPLDSKTDTFSLEWSFILSLIQQKDMDSATKILAWLISKTKDQNKRDKTYLTIGRLLADIGELSASVNYYEQVRKSYYFWLFAQEEKAWLFFNKKDYGKAYSTASVFEYPKFKREISPYMFFILALSQLKNCDYEGVARSLSDFKLVFSKRETEIRKTLSSNSYEKLTERLLAFYHSRNAYYEIGKTDLLYHLRKDSFLKNHILLKTYMQNRQSVRKSQFKSLDKAERKIVNQLNDKIGERIQQILQKEIKQIKFVLNNFQVIEAESLYRIHGFHSLLSNQKPMMAHSIGPTLASYFYKSNDTVYFPFDPNEIWLDELSAYKNKLLENCPKGSYIL